MQIQCQNKTIELENGATVRSLFTHLNLNEPHQGLAAAINGTLQDVDTPLSAGDDVSIFSFDDKEGKEVFWHTSAHLLAQAILRIYPKAKPTIGPPIQEGFYYDFANLVLSEEDFPKIEKEIQSILKEKLKPSKEIFKSKEEASKAFLDNPYKKQLIDSFEEGSTLSAYRQGEFFDLCLGPHLPSLNKIKAFKLLKTSGAYWRGDSSREMLTRIYAISFPSRESLKNHLHVLEEAKKRDHRVLGSKLHLFSFREEAAGMPFIHPRGMKIWNTLIDFWKKLHEKALYEEIKTPQMMNQELWERSGHWEYYRENMYTLEIDERKYALKPMNCPGCMLYFGSKRHSYRDLPLRVAELGHVHRHELSGALSGLLRVRAFHQDDAHLFMREDQIKEEIVEVLKLVDILYKTFGLSYHLELSTRPEKEKTIGSDREWEVATEGLQKALDTWGMPYQVNEGDGAFYGPKIDLHVLDALGRSWQCGTIQLDMSLPEKFNLTYTSKEGEQKRPVMVHRALFGSIERFFAILVEHFAGKFPLWLSPVPIQVIPIADRHLEESLRIQDILKSKGLDATVDASHESLSKKIKMSQMQHFNYMITIGDQELENGTISFRSRDNTVYNDISFDTFVETILEEKNSQSLVSLFQKEAP